jgi:UDP-N-acetylglucosamine 1-carboxyvinyltransferase
MDKFLINGNRPLYGEVTVDTAKNALLPILAASLLTPEKVVLHNCRPIADVENMSAILRHLGCAVTSPPCTAAGDIEVNAASASGYEIDGALAGELRSSVFMLGPVLGRFRRACVAYPGGCDIGLRPIDLHLKGLRCLNVRIREENGFIVCDGADMRGAPVTLDYPSVGATENIMVAAVTARGETVIRNAAKEPEIEDLQDFINAMGGGVSGAGTDTVRVTGVKALHGAEFTPIPDRIIGGTYLLACAAAGGKVTLRNARPEHLTALLERLRNAGVKIECASDTVTAEADGRLAAARLVETLPYPGFPTDLQAQLLALQTVSEGVCIVIENLFETRFKHEPELIKMGADITVRDRAALIRGVPRLNGAEIYARDLRGGAALVIAGLAAHGRTTVHNIRHIERGYFDLDGALRSLGADIVKI